MDSRPWGKPNFALLGAVLFSVFCWICLYAAFADFAQVGFAMMTRAGFWYSVAGAALVGLHVLGLLLVFVLAGGTVAVLVRTPQVGNHDRHVNGNAH